MGAEFVIHLRDTKKGSATTTRKCHEEILLLKSNGEPIAYFDLLLSDSPNKFALH